VAAILLVIALQDGGAAHQYSLGPGLPLSGDASATEFVDFQPVADMWL